MEAVSIVTGAQQGIGAAIARSLAALDTTCIVNYLDDKPAALEVVAEIEAEGGRAVAIAADIAKADDVQRLFAAAAELGRLRFLVNNAAIFPRRALLDMSDEDWDGVLNVNLRGAFLCLRAAGRAMADGAGGAIVNISSLAASRHTPSGAHYTASKAGLLGLTRAAAFELAPHAIRVNAVSPGLTDTAQPRFGMTEDEIAEAATLIPLGRLAGGSDIADAVSFLCSDAARHITGQVLHVNGGQYFG